MADPVFEAFKDAYLRGVQAIKRGDFRTAWESVSEDCEFYPPAEFPDPSVRRGPDQIAEFMREIREVVPDWYGDPDEFIDAGGGIYVVHLEMSGTSGGMGIPMSSDLFQVFEIRDGTAVQVREFLRRDQAMRAAGLED